MQTTPHGIITHSPPLTPALTITHHSPSPHHSLPLTPLPPPLSTTHRAFETLKTMQKKGVEPDGTSYAHVLRACVGARVPTQADKAVKMMRQAGLVPDVRIYSMLLSAYGKAGRLRASLAVLKQMRLEGVKPNGHVYAGLMEVSASTAQHTHTSHLSLTAHLSLPPTHTHAGMRRREPARRRAGHLQADDESGHSTRRRHLYSPTPRRAHSPRARAEPRVGFRPEL